ncbi:hypothetical protein QC762_300860 [Podospora pseudocomata]|uniref:Uncharacterized protein n=1 Tax=Podospora pseudocomata TaxID=2093779 RepID=A0ABR0GIB1_9PEZI|nr:hypothetical protein QC762_300860 [Podospora pseudocomata]
MESTMDIAQLVAQMQDTLSTIHTTLASLNTAEHDAKLDELEARRDNTIKHLLAAFSAESEVLHQKRLAQREEIAKRRRIEDEERERRRRQEDEELAERDKQEDEARDGRLLHETNEVEEETDHLMIEIEEEAQRAIDEGQKKLMGLEERRKELNHLIEEQLRAPIIPSPPKRSRRGSNLPPAVATPSKPPEPVAPESLDNDGAKALEPEDISTSRHDEITETAHKSPTIPQADMVKESTLNTDANSQMQASPTNDSRPTSRQDRPLFVQPVISRSGTILHADQLEETARAPVEPIGIPNRNTDSPDPLDSSKPDVTWWENKRREEAERALHHPATPSPSSSHTEAEDTGAPSQLPAEPGVKDADQPSSSQATPGATRQAVESGDVAQPAEETPAMPQLEHISFAADEEQENTHNASFELTEASVTPEHHGSELSVNGDAASSVSSYHNQPSIEYRTTSDEPPAVGVPEGMDDSCSLTDTSEYCQHEEVSDRHHPHRPPLIHSESYTGDERVDEVDIPLRRVPSHQPPREEFGHEEVGNDQHAVSDHETDVCHALAPVSQEQELDEHPHTPSLQVIREDEVLESTAEETVAPEPQQHGAVGLGTEDSAHAEKSIVEHDPHHGSELGHDEDVPALSSSSDHGDHTHSSYDDGSHLEDDYAQPEPITPNPLILQPFRTGDGGDRGSPVRDRDVPKLPDDVGRHGEGDAEPGVSGAGGQPGDQAHLGVLRDDGYVGGGAAEGAEEKAEESLVPGAEHVSDAALPPAGLQNEEAADDQLRRASQVSNESVEMDAAYTTTVNGEGELFDDDDDDDDDDEGDAESDVSDIEDAYLNEEGVVDAVVAAMGPEPEDQEHTEKDAAIVKTSVDEVAEVPTEVPAEAPAELQAIVAADAPVHTSTDIPLDTVLDRPVGPTVEMPEPMAAQVEAGAHIQVPDETPFATPMEVPGQAEPKAQVLNTMGDSDGTPAVSATVPPVETPEPDHPRTSPNWVNEADDYFAELDQRQETPRLQFFEQQRTDVKTSLAPDSQTASQGLSASIHNPDRPETPDQDTELAYQEHRSTHLHSQEQQQSSPQSVRSQSTIDSAPPSPEPHTVTDTHVPVIRGLVSTQSPSYQTGRPRNNSHLTEYDHHRDESEDTPLAKWRHRESTLSMPDQPPVAPLDTAHSSKHSHASSESGDQKGGSLFQRMRNVFEQQSHASDINTSRSSQSRPISTDRHSGGGGGGGGSGLWGSGGPLSGRFGKSWSSSSNEHHHHRDYHHSPYTEAGHSPVRGTEGDHDAPGIEQLRKPFEVEDQDEKAEEEDEVTFPLRAPIVLRDNFDRLNVISVQAQVPVDDVLDSSSSSSSSSVDHRFSWASSIPSSCVPLSVVTTATTAAETEEDGEEDIVEVVAGKKGLGRRSLVLSPSSSVRRQRGNGEVEKGSELRLPWLWVQGWRARLQKAGDEIERVRWEGRLENHVVRGREEGRQRRECREERGEERHEVVVKRLPAGMSKARRGVVVNVGEYVSVVEVGGALPKKGRRKSVHWA